MLREIISRRVHDALRAFFDVMRDSPTDNRIGEEAAEAARLPGRRVLHLPSQDILIASCGRRIGAAVLTYGNHFHDIPGVTVLSSLDQLN